MCLSCGDSVDGLVYDYCAVSLFNIQEWLVCSIKL